MSDTQTTTDVPAPPARGHNSSIEGRHLMAFIERIERQEEEKKEVADGIKDIYAEAKGVGYDVKIIRKIVSIRKQDQDKRREEEYVLETYLQAIGMQA